MTFKSILLASAAAFAATSAFAADATPAADAAPVAASYVKICDSFGAGYFYIPGSDTCLKISGRVRAIGSFYENGSRGDTNTTGPHANAKGTFWTDGRIDVGTAQASEWGKVESNIRFRYDPTAGTPSAGGQWTNGAGLYVENVYVSVGPVSVGQRIRGLRYADDLGSFGTYDNFALANTYANRLGGSFNELRYDQDLGNGFAARAGLEYQSTTNTQYATLSPTSTNGVQSTKSMPILAGELKYSSGPIKNIILFGQYDTANQNNTVANGNGALGGGYVVGVSGEYVVLDNLTARAGVSYSRTANVPWTNLFAGAKYDINKQVSIYGDVGYIYKQNNATSAATSVAGNNLYLNAGVDYTIAKNVTASLEETYISGQYNDNIKYNENGGGNAGWTTFVMLNRAF